jgi:hypothetical protein
MTRRYIDALLELLFGYLYAVPLLLAALFAGGMIASDAPQEVVIASVSLLVGVVAGALVAAWRDVI